jgi:hypothetical protein
VPAIEIGIAASAILLGAAVISEARPPLMVAAALVASSSMATPTAPSYRPGQWPALQHGLRDRYRLPARVGNHDWYSPPLDVGTEAAAFGRRWR